MVGMDSKTIARNIRRLRASSGLTLDEMAAVSGLGVVTIRNLEKGERSPTVRTVAKAAAALGVPPAMLLTDMYPGAKDGVLPT